MLKSISLNINIYFFLVILRNNQLKNEKIPLQIAPQNLKIKLIPNTVMNKLNPNKAPVW